MNGISGSHAPADEHLVELFRNSDTALSAALNLAVRREANFLARIDMVRRELQTMLEAIDKIEG